MKDWLQRELDPACPPWLTVRFWLTLLGLLISVAVLVLAL